MKEIKLAKNEDSFRLLDNWHDRFASQLTLETETRRVETSFGFVDVMIAGRDQSGAGESAGLPIVLLHGAMAGAPFALGELTNVPKGRQIFAVNVPGQSTRAAQVRLDFRNDEYARWMCEVCDGLGLDRVVLCGVSWGGSVALRVAQHASQRIAGLVLVVPGSIVRGPFFKGFWQVGFPMMRYKLRPTSDNLERALNGLLTTNDETWTPYLGDAIRHWNVDFSVPPLMKPSDLESFQAPVYVMAADQDVSFPGKPLLAQSKTLFSNLAGTHLMAQTKHCPSFAAEARENFTRIFEQAIHAVAPLDP